MGGFLALVVVALAISFVAVAAAAEGNLTWAVRGLFVVAERHPHSRARQNSLFLRGELSGIEEATRASRIRHNSVVRKLKTAGVIVPRTLVARVAGPVRILRCASPLS